METTARLLNGDLVTVEVPGAVELPTGTTVAVIEVGDGERELTSGTPGALDFFLSETGSSLTGEVTLGDGHLLRHGPLGGDPGHGTAFSVAVGEHRVFGSAPPRPGVEKLAAFLGRMHFRATAQGPRASPDGLTWSPTRTFALAQQVDLGGPRGYLLDVRRARGGPARRRRAEDGIRVPGGRLHRSPAGDERRHVILDAPEVVCYGIPFPGTTLDDVVASMSDVATDVS